MISFLGQVPASKSLLNRALIIQSYFPQLKIHGDSDCNDVQAMRSGLRQLLEGQVVDCGEGGTTLRFLSLRASRIPGRHVLKGSERLMQRPQAELIRILKQLGVEAVLENGMLTINSQGWRPQGDTLHVPSQRSSQFVSAVLLNAWDLPFDLYVSPVGAGVSEGYWRMTQKLVVGLGMRLDKWDHDFRVPGMQKINLFEWRIEPDMSSAFALAAIAAMGGQFTLVDLPVESWQPDFIFLDILAKMGVKMEIGKGRLQVQSSPHLRGVAVRLTNAPDLFPILAALCAVADGDSDLYGAPQLVHKESHRIQKIVELLRITGRTLQPTLEGLRISGTYSPAQELLSFDPDFDHRLAMAAAVLQAKGLPIEIVHPDVVNKSFPGFWRAIGQASC